MIAAFTWPAAIFAVLLQPQVNNGSAVTMKAGAEVNGLGVPQRLTPDLQVTPIGIVEDSRCPVDVTCVQAGHLIVNLRISHRGDVRTQALQLGAPAIVPGGVLTLTDAGERRAADEAAGPETYRFTFSFAPDIAT